VKFQVSFTVRGGSFAISVQPRDLGLNALDKARRATGVPQLPAERVNDMVPHRLLDPRIEVGEGLARRSGHFCDSWLVKVVVPARGLNRFVHMKPVVFRDETTGEITKVGWEWNFQPQDIIEAWEEAGFPLEWDPEA